MAIQIYLHPEPLRAVALSGNLVCAVGAHTATAFEVEGAVQERTRLGDTEEWYDIVPFKGQFDSFALTYAQRDENGGGIVLWTPGVVKVGLSLGFPHWLFRFNAGWAFGTRHAFHFHQGGRWTRTWHAPSEIQSAVAAADGTLYAATETAVYRIADTSAEPIELISDSTLPMLSVWQDVVLEGGFNIAPLRVLYAKTQLPALEFIAQCGARVTWQYTDGEILLLSLADPDRRLVALERDGTVHTADIMDSFPVQAYALNSDLFAVSCAVDGAEEEVYANYLWAPRTGYLERLVPDSFLNGACIFGAGDIALATSEALWIKTGDSQRAISNTMCWDSELCGVVPHSGSLVGYSERAVWRLLTT